MSVWDNHPFVNIGQAILGKETGFERRFHSAKAMIESAYLLSTSSEARENVGYAISDFWAEGISSNYAFGEKILGPGYFIAVSTAIGAKGFGPAAKGASSGAESALQGAQLNRHLTQLEKYGSAGSKTLENGRIRYYGDVAPARTPGDMVGRRLVREWDPSSNATRTWHETLDGAGTVRQVRPVTDGPKIHYRFDANGNYIGSW